MKRSVLSVLLVLILLVAVSAFAVQAEDVTKITYEEAVITAGGVEGGTLNFWCEACQDNVDWTPAAVSNKKFTPATGHGYVPSTSKLSDSTALNPSNFTNVNGKLCVYLKGDVLYTGTTRMFQLYSKNSTATNCQLNIMGTGTIKSTGVMSTATTALILATTNTSGGTNEFVMYGGTIDCSASSNSASGATVFCANGTTTTERTDRFIMKDGTIKGGSSESGGSTLKFNYTGEFEMTGGEIIGSTSESNVGGAIYMVALADAKRPFTMSGGTIYGATATAI